MLVYENMLISRTELCFYNRTSLMLPVFTVNYPFLNSKVLILATYNSHPAEASSSS